MRTKEVNLPSVATAIARPNLRESQFDPRRLASVSSCNLLLARMAAGARTKDPTCIKKSL
jgi:hypothetical protein